jgi:hypothetical protein
MARTDNKIGFRQCPAGRKLTAQLPDPGAPFSLDGKVVAFYVDQRC